MNPKIEREKNMNQSACMYTNYFSAIEGLQKQRIITYCAEDTPNGVFLRLHQKSDLAERAEACLCPGISIETATRFLKYIWENRIGVGCWYEILHDLDIPFTVV